MEEFQRSKRRRVYPHELNAIFTAGFSHKYLSYLLPALRNATGIGTCNASKDRNIIAKFVRFEVDMALALSAGKFNWTRALKSKLQRRTDEKQPCFSLSPWHCPAVPRPLVPIDVFEDQKPQDELKVASKAGRIRSWRSAVEKRREEAAAEEEEEKELRCQIAILRRILPGGDGMELHELLTEVESYVICLQLQVNVLSSLVAIR